MNTYLNKPNQNLLPWQVTGFTDGDGSFTYSITHTSLTTFRISLEFKVTQKNHSEGILHELKEYFECGSVVVDNRKTGAKKFHTTSLKTILNNCYLFLIINMYTKPLNFTIYFNEVVAIGKSSKMAVFGGILKLGPINMAPY